MTPAGEAVKRRIQHALGQDIGDAAAAALAVRAQALAADADLPESDPDGAHEAAFAETLATLADDG